MKLPLARLVVVLVFLASSACSSTRVTTNTKRSWTEQLLVTEAVERALEPIRWPRVEGLAVFVETVSTGADADNRYLTAAVEKRLALGGAEIVEEKKHADLVATVVAGSLGTQESQTFIGIPQMQSVVVPVPFPELALYKKTFQDGFAKTEIVMRESESGKVVFHDGPSEGRTYDAHYQVLLVGLDSSDPERRTD